MVLADGFPSDGPPCKADKIAGQRAKLEEFQRRAVGNGTAELSSPARIAESGELVAF